MNDPMLASRSRRAVINHTCVCVCVCGFIIFPYISEGPLVRIEERGLSWTNPPIVTSIQPISLNEIDLNARLRIERLTNVTSFG